MSSSISRKSLILLRYLSLVVLLIGLTLLMTGCTTGGRADAATAEAGFEAVIGRAVTSGVTLKTERATYTQGDRIVFWIENRTDHDLWFVNDNFGVRSYRYDSAASGWQEVDLGNEIINPQPWKVPAHHLLDSNLGNLDTDFFKQTGRIRLVAKGCLALEQVNENCADYAAYVDIEVKPRRQASWRAPWARRLSAPARPSWGAGLQRQWAPA